uniref:Uncharacterized protein n=1 Tax=Anguilla anguilla TaxID=7936 RepID=A0A0E9PIF6_ANGAN
MQPPVYMYVFCEHTKIFPCVGVSRSLQCKITLVTVVHHGYKPPITFQTA